MPKRGYDVHHIVEQTAAERDGFSRREIDAPGNLVSIPRMKHWEINGWYARPNEAMAVVAATISARQGLALREKSWPRGSN